ncbi:hypothetical protein [Streptomyces sp. NPDC014733]|uniref:hypothetical protein n=1 Tax=Streptomyces sp. NPDC014733 TaxID=3364885 RepID=UPI0037006AC9
MATIDPAAREQQLQDAQALLQDRYGDGRPWHDPVRAMHAVRAAADGYGLADGAEPVDVPAEDVLAALTQLDQARADLDVLERVASPAPPEPAMPPGSRSPPPSDCPPAPARNPAPSAWSAKPPVAAPTATPTSCAPPMPATAPAMPGAAPTSPACARPSSTWRPSTAPGRS